MKKLLTGTFLDDTEETLTSADVQRHELLTAVSQLHADVLKRMSHQEEELSRHFGELSEQQDRMTQIWTKQHLHLEELLEGLLTRKQDSKTRALSLARQGIGPVGPTPPLCNPPDLPDEEHVSFEAVPLFDSENRVSGSSVQESSVRATRVKFTSAPDETIESTAVALLSGQSKETLIVKQEKATLKQTAAKCQARSGSSMYCKDAHMHWRRMIRKKYNRKQVLEPVSTHSRSERELQLTRCQRIVRSRFYEMSSLLLVIVNAAFIGWQVQYFATYSVTAPHQEKGELVFVILFTLELLTRFCAERLHLFQTVEWGWNAFDVVVVTSMLIEHMFTALSSNGSTSSLLSQMSGLRVLRVVRVVRVLKVIRVLKFFRELRMMVQSILSSFKSLVWAVMVQVVMFYIFGISLTQGVVDYCASTESCSSASTAHMRQHFGGLGRSILSLFEAMAGGISWGELMDAIAPLDEAYHAIFLIYISFAIFAVANIVTAVFVEGAMLNAQHDREVVIQEQMRSNQAYLDSMQHIFYELDRDDNGNIEIDELKKAIKDHRVVAYFNAFGLDVTDVNTLFVLLDRDQTGHIDIDEFLLGCMRLKGGAKSLDIAKMQYDMEWIVHNIESLTMGLDSLGKFLRDTSGFQWESIHTKSVRLNDNWNWGDSNGDLASATDENGDPAPATQSEGDTSEKEEGNVDSRASRSL